MQLHGVPWRRKRGWVLGLGSREMTERPDENLPLPPLFSSSLQHGACWDLSPAVLQLLPFVYTSRVPVTSLCQKKPLAWAASGHALSPFLNETRRRLPACLFGPVDSLQMCPVLSWCGLNRETQTHQASWKSTWPVECRRPSFALSPGNPVTSLMSAVVVWNLIFLGSAYFSPVPFTVLSPHLTSLSATPGTSVAHILGTNFFVPHFGHRLF